MHTKVGFVSVFSAVVVVRLATLYVYVQTLCRWIMSVRINYHDHAYHNWQHAVTVMQTMFAMITVC